MSGPLLFLVPARGGSVRIPGKNLRTVTGIPLVARAVRTARLAGHDIPGGPHRVVCSTDSPQIAEIAAAWGASILMRPAELATSDATSLAVALHALDTVAGGPFRGLILVQPTSPLLTPVDLVRAVAAFDAAGGDRPVVGITASHPAGWHGDIGADGSLRRRTSPGENLAAHLVNGAVYVVAPGRLRATHEFGGSDAVAFPMPAERSVDVDEERDLAIAEAFAAALPHRDLALAGHVIGGGRVFVIAEAGVNHNGDPALAHALIDAAAGTGADAVKFQTFNPDALAAAGAPMAEYQRAAGERGADQREMLARLALPADVWAALQAHARERGIVFMSTPFDLSSAQLLHGLGVPAFKIGSGELTNLPFLAEVAALGRPMLVSTGMADMREVAAAVDTIAAAGNPPIALLHCVSSYPADPGDANLLAMATMASAFGVPTGWSDHTPGIELAIASAALGAALIEKHLTTDRTLPGPDHAASLEPEDFAALVRGVRIAAASRGTGHKQPVAAELDVARVARRSLHWRRDLAAGALIGRDDLVVLRPASGLGPDALDDVTGRRTTEAVRAGTPCLAIQVDGLG